MPRRRRDFPPADHSLHFARPGPHRRKDCRMSYDHRFFHAAEDSLRLRIGAGILSLILLATSIAALRPGF